MIILTLAAGNLPPCVRWPLPFFIAGVHFFTAGMIILTLAAGNSSVCPLVAAALHLAGVHFSSRFPAGMVVSPLPAGNLPPCARWPLPFFISPACIFSPPA